MKSRQKIFASVWTSVLLVPILVVIFSYGNASCGEYDPCSTGARFPYAGWAVGLGVILEVIQSAYIVTIWRSDADHVVRIDQGNRKGRD